MFWKIIKVFILLSIFIELSISFDQKISNDTERSLSRQKRLLFFPQFTVWQLSMALVAQVSKITSHKFAINSGFQINYALPYNLSNFYKPTYFTRARSIFNISSPITSFFNRLIESGDNFGLENSPKVSPTELPITINNENFETTNGIVSDIYLNVNDNEETTTEIQSTTQKKLKEKLKTRTKKDITAAEFYSGIKDTLKIVGYHEDCLLKSICELAKHPLTDTKNDLMYEIIHLVLTPSVHRAFDPQTEENERKIYEEAELFGFSGGDCESIYKTCESSPLHSISNYITEEIYD